ncbi:Nucleoporin p58/p45 [Mortierella polycephala]|uniref:Nucleoporin p58/p45 n=1 Tax=Mortierella polycephala TaxID=41804 RepID=A0A9P6PLB4_9FUNG|nr:Nucleoporin p58/p45 [Mortierella polycephala]
MVTKPLAADLASPAAASIASNPFGSISTAPATFPAATSGVTNPFGSLGATPTSSTAATAATSTATAPSVNPLFPSLNTSTTTSTAPAASLFATAPPSLSGGSLFNTSNANAASNTLSNAASKSMLGASSSNATNTVTLTADTIAGSTKYTELPADFKNVLDQLHTVLQGQIHLSATLTARPSESLDKISKDTSELSKRLATLNDALDRDTKVIQALQNKVAQELKQADSAGRIIEAYASTSHANFLYAGNNSAGQYFMDQCQSFEDQLRQFRSTIEEIERHLASFSSRHPQVSHALPEVMRNQHEGFLAVAGRVAALHDDIKDKEKAYLMFRRKYFDDDSDPFQAGNKLRKTENIHHHHGSVIGYTGRPLEGQKSFREIAKETLRPGGAAPKPGTATGSANPFQTSTVPTSTGSSLFNKPVAFGATSTTATNAPPTFSLTAPTPAAPTLNLFGAPAAAATSTTPFSGFKK